MKISVLTPSIRPDGLKALQGCLEKQTLQDFEWLVELGIPGRGHDLNAAYNRMLRRAKGELVVSYQDYTRILDDGLERFWNAYRENPRTFYTAPHGKVLDWNDKPEWDWRAYSDAKPDWKCWEIDWGCAPLSALKEIGGFDEELDKRWSADNLVVGKKAALAGYSFANLHENPAVGLKHNLLMRHPFSDKFDPAFIDSRLRAVEMGEAINYLE